METWEYLYFIGLPAMLWVLLVIPAFVSKTFFIGVYGGNKEWLGSIACISLTPVFNIFVVLMVIAMIILVISYTDNFISKSLKYIGKIANKLLPEHLKF